MVEQIEFFVAGTPVPQGSTKAFYIKKIEKVVTTHSNKSTGAWRQRIASEAQRISQGFYEDDRMVGYEMDLMFIFEKPKSAPKRWVHDTKRPDLDKLVRACLDALTNIAFPDDSQVITITAGKRYAGPNEVPGLRVSVKKKRL